jgi:hypothetical protein
VLFTTPPKGPFPADALCRALAIEQRFNDAEIERILGYQYQGKYTNLVLSLLYPDRDWKNAIFHEDHIFPQAEFKPASLKLRGYDPARTEALLLRFNTICNLQLLTDSENLAKNATPFDVWLASRDATFRTRHAIPELPNYDFDSFEAFADARRGLISDKLKSI